MIAQEPVNLGPWLDPVTERNLERDARELQRTKPSRFWVDAPSASSEESGE